MSEPARPREHEGIASGTVHSSDGASPESRCARCSCGLGHYYERGSRVTLIDPHYPKGSWATFWRPDCLIREAPRGAA